MAGTTREWNINAVPLFSEKMLMTFLLLHFTFFLSKKGHYQAKKYWSIFVKKEQQYLLIMSILIAQSSARSLHYSSCLANLSNFVFQEFNIHEKYFPNILNDKDDILRFQGCLTPIYLLSHLYSVASKCDLNTSMYLNLRSLFQDWFY